jgi:hemerythrin-like domain-containing protein
VEHGVLDDLLEKLLKSRKTETDEWKAHAKVLFDLLDRHMAEENERLCAALEEHFGDEERETMGRRFTAAKARLNMKLKAPRRETRWHRSWSLSSTISKLRSPRPPICAR